jgi:hypothetical protein
LGSIVLDLHREHDVAAVEAEQLLHMVIGRANYVEVVEPDEVRPPLPGVNVGQEGCIGRERDDVGIALDAGEKRRFGEGAARLLRLSGDTTPTLWAAYSPMNTLGPSRS